ncbi:hypothetical protein M0208_13910 [Sphingomonas sp. SUN019]|uniref:hypothetical protein n=1 Tax=Sphingomonas sp. SUN019 TaxID=2937788 RepID=UPI0021649EE7|nr:hypothetical protein [Sphingomonas sp. SUN019]UVO51543.1 hypothetical protein M0208_13910 [Sphingomonas sp. SUN019]
MPTDISHLPPAPRRVIPSSTPQPDDHRTPLTDWLAHIAAGRIGANPPASAAVTANRDASAALFTARRREQRA